MFHIFGIRHHGPGSSKRLMKALADLQPDCILIEAPMDAEGVLKDAGHPDIVPPVALLIYNPKNFNQASYYPFARFSPEWQAIQYGLALGIPVRFMDLPMSMMHQIRESEKQQLKIDIPDPEALRAQRDPLGFMAQIAGYSDSERWWEITFEQETEDTEVFEGILEMMEALRSELKRSETKETLLREAHMRKVMRKALKDGFQRIAVVCGAWHGPVLQDIAAYKVSADNTVLKGLKKTKIAATWIPWSYDRLAFSSGYGAGVVSPAWYEVLFEHSEDVAIHWMTRVARLFRESDMDASAAHALEAVRLAQTLASLRKRAIVGIDELEEAAIAIFCDGDRKQLDLIREKLVIGDVIGKVPSQIQSIPLQQDLEKKIKSARLTKEWNTTEVVEKKLDLRKPANLTASLLLHRLALLDIFWGQLLQNSEYTLGSFSESWKLKWQPDFSIAIIEAGMWGNTVEEAATKITQNKVAKIEQLPELTDLVEKALKADLSKAIPALVKQLEDVSILTKDILHLMEALPAMVRMIKYGNTRKTDVRAVEKLVDQITPRICIGLPALTLNIEEEFARDIFKQVLRVNNTISLLQEDFFEEAWGKALDQVAMHPNANPLLQGVCLRLLFEKRIIDLTKTADEMAFALSNADFVLGIALWLEGFLYGSGMMLLHNPELWQLLDDWVRVLDEDLFKEVLPVMRRTFSSFTIPEREKLMQLAKRQVFPEQRKKEQKEEYDAERMAEISTVLKLFLGQ
ncbi:MAG: DUF5682 family protein [Saprospiraceae bacterium]|nr:DUF5682 family protein [Saprospiraceae bacterium]